LFPAFPIIALVIAIISFAAMVVYNFKLAVFYFLLLGGGYLIFKWVRS
jgi:ethanolamine permease